MPSLSRSSEKEQSTAGQRLFLGKGVYIWSALGGTGMKGQVRETAQ
jgi:hypothetical protein